MALIRHERLNMRFTTDIGDASVEVEAIGYNPPEPKVGLMGGCFDEIDIYLLNSKGDRIKQIQVTDKWINKLERIALEEREEYWVVW